MRLGRRPRCAGRAPPAGNALLGGRDAGVGSADGARAVLADDVDRLKALGPLLDFELDDLVFEQPAPAVPLNLGIVNKDVGARVLLDEPPALLIVEPLHTSHCHRIASTAIAGSVWFPCLLPLRNPGGRRAVLAREALGPTLHGRQAARRDSGVR